MEDNLNIEVLNREIIEAITDADDGVIKSASSAGSNMIRRRIREDGFSRNILPPKAVTNDQLDRVADHDRPVMIEDMEPESRGAKSIPFGDTADTEFYYGSKYVCSFNAITTPEFTKDINELRTYRMDLRRVITDNALRDIQAEEDHQFLTAVNTIVGSVGGTGASGRQQNFNIQKSNANYFDRSDYVSVLSVLEDMNLNNGVFLMNRKTAKTFLTFNRDEIGGDLAQPLLTDGLTALQEAKIFGVKHLFTMKSDMVADNEMYLFAEPDYLGKFYTLQEPTMYVEKKKDILRFSARETISVTFANLAGVAKVNFT